MAAQQRRLDELRAWVARRPVATALAAAALGLGAILILHGPSAGRTVWQSQVVQPSDFASTIAVVGTIAPDQNIYVTAPAAGAVKQVGFEYGVPVTRGQVLAQIDDADVRQRRDEARAAYLKALQAANEMATWPTGPDASRDRRAAAAAAYDLVDTRQKAAETKRLLDRGLVARDEYDAILAQQRTQEMALASARQDLAATLARGSGADRQVTAIELKDTRAQLAELEAEVAGAVVRAPADGVIVRPPADKDNTAAQIHVGQQLTKGQLIGSIAKPGGLAVTFQLNETDANAVRPGQAVSITGPGFGDYSLSGHVTSVAGEAAPNAPGTPATFAATARLDPLTPSQARAVRIGMTANVVIATYSAAGVLVAPPAAIRGAAPDALVTIKDPLTGQRRAAHVHLGHINPDGVEVLSGLKAGDTVVWPAPVNEASN
jgi:multidrug efflux pump subunit AcrA (membrane-fusion protein)